MKKVIMGWPACSKLMAAIPATASGGAASELRKATAPSRSSRTGYSGYSVYAFCDQKAPPVFGARSAGSRGDCFVSGHAWRRAYAARGRDSQLLLGG